MAKPDEKKIATLKDQARQAIATADPEFLIGVDEVGFGPIAGPLVIGAVGVPVDWVGPTGLTDSKELSSKQIATLVVAFQKMVGMPNIHSALIWTSSEDIDRYGLGRMRRQSIINGIGAIRGQFGAHARTLAIVDGNLNLPDSISIPKADLVCPVVSMAAVLAKHARDEWMTNTAAKEHPGYGFDGHVGYDTTAHRDAIRRLGPCPIHRMSTSTLQKAVRGTL